MKDNDKLVAKKEQKIIDFTYRFCGACGMAWYFKDEKTKPPSNFFVSSECHIESNGKIQYISAICPQCGSYNHYKCPQCNVWISKRWLCDRCRKPLKRNSETGELSCDLDGSDFEPRQPEFFCTKCGQIYRHVIKQLHDQIRRTTYILGVENGVCLRIDEEGNVEVTP